MAKWLRWTEKKSLWNRRADSARNRPGGPALNGGGCWLGGGGPPPPPGWPPPPPGPLGSSSETVGSYCVFSNLVMSRSSSSPNSPPISEGSPTTITSCARPPQNTVTVSPCRNRIRSTFLVASYLYLGVVLDWLALVRGRTLTKSST